MANAGTSNENGKPSAKLPLPQLSKEAAKADLFNKFPTSLMSVDNTNNDGNVSTFAKDGFTVHKEEDMLITCKGAPIFIGARDKQGRYHIPLVQRRGQWCPYKPSNAAREKNLGKPAASTTFHQTTRPSRGYIRCVDI